MRSGWIKFYRKTFDGDRSLEDIGRWLWLLCAAEYEDEYRGKLITTYPSIANSWGTTPRRVDLILKSWEKENQIQVRKIKKTEVNRDACTPPSAFAPKCVTSSVIWGIEISIINYDTYQSGSEDRVTSNAPSSGNSKEKNKKEISSAQGPSSSKKPRLKKKDSKAHPRHQEVIDHFCQKFEQRFGIKYAFQVKDAAAIKRWLNILDADDLIARMDMYLADDEPFLLKNGHSIALLQTRINAYGKPNFGEKSTKGSGYLERTY